MDKVATCVDFKRFIQASAYKANVTEDFNSKYDRHPHYIGLYYENAMAYGWERPHFIHQDGINACAKCLDSALRNLSPEYYPRSVFKELGDISNILKICIPHF